MALRARQINTCANCHNLLLRELCVILASLSCRYGCSMLFITAPPEYSIGSGDLHSEIERLVRFLHGYWPICVFCVHLW